LTHNLPTDTALLCLVVLLLGARHGFDADHLAAIDGMTRLHGRSRRALARWCGALFSLGHGGVVMLVALALSGLQGSWQAPQWLDAAGRGISIVFLLLLGIANLRALLAVPAGQRVAPAGLRSRLIQDWLQHWLQGRSPWAVAGVGALFALSFDTLSQAAMFAVAGSAAGGMGLALLLGLLFTIGMMMTDALNGWWLARLLARADALAVRASRVMGWAVAGTSLMVAALALARWTSGVVDGWAGQQDLLLGAVVLSVLALSYGVARGLVMAGSQQPGQTTHPV
jgi:high-affinity nickel-transport protein